MLLFTHTYLLQLAMRQFLPNKPVEEYAELVVGNVIPDFITFLGKHQHQALAHDFHRYERLADWRPVTLGAYFHIISDNLSTLGVPRFEGDYYDQPLNGFIEQRARLVQQSGSIQVPPRRFLQCALDMLILRHYRQPLMEMVKYGVLFFNQHRNDIVRHFAMLYELDASKLNTALERFNVVYGESYLDRAATEMHRLFPLARAYYHLPLNTPPQEVADRIHNNPELLQQVEQNMHLIDKDWEEVLIETANRAIHTPYILKNLHRLYGVAQN